MSKQSIEEVELGPAFTPGPWEVKRAETEAEWDVMTKDGFYVAQTFEMLGENDCDETLSNARLIAAAPALYAACDAIIQWDKAEKTSLPYDDDNGAAFRERVRLCDEAMTKARAALALASQPEKEIK